jgi:hypothetical protein
LACVGCIFFIYRRLTSIEKQPAKIDNQEDKPAELPEPDIQEIREALIAYIERESSVLELDDFGEDEYIGYFCGYGHYKIWLSIWIGPDLDIIATNLMMGKEYLETFKRLQENRHKIEWLFPEKGVLCGLLRNGYYRIGLEKNVDLSQRENWQTTSVWVRENLEKLFWVISVHDKLPSDNDLPF